MGLYIVLTPSGTTELLDGTIKLPDLSHLGVVLVGQGERRGLGGSGARRAGSRQDGGAGWPDSSLHGESRRSCSGGQAHS